MKFSTLSSYETYLKTLEPSQLSAVTLLVCKDGFERKQAVDATLALARDLEIKRFEGASVNRRELFDELNTLPFLGVGLCVVLHDVERLDKQILSALSQYAEKPNRAISLVMDTAALSASTKLCKQCEKSAVYCAIPELRPWEKEKQIESWIRERVAVEGKKIDVASTQLMVRQLGTDKQLLEGEILKVCCYVGGRPGIAVDDVTAICACVNLDSIWQLGEAILRRQVGKALRISRDLQRDGMAFLTLLWQLRSQIQTSFQICSILQSGGGPPRVAESFPYMKGRILERNMQLAQGYGLVRFKRGVLLMNQIDVKVKNGAGPTDILAEHLVTKLCQ